MTGLSTRYLMRLYSNAIREYWMATMFDADIAIRERKLRQIKYFQYKVHERLTELEEKAARFDLPDSLSVEDKETKHVWIHKHLKGIHGGTKPPDDWKAD